MLKRLLPKQSGFYDFFNEHAQTTLQAVRILYDAIRNLKDNKCQIDRISELEHACDKIAHKTIDLLHRTFITPLDRDEIHQLISRMDDIVDMVDAAAHRLVLFEIDEVPPEIVQLCEVLLKTQENVTEMVKLLRNIRQTKKLQEYCMEINRLENEGDQLHRKGIASLFHTYKDDPLMVIKLKAVYEILEAAIDHCEDVADIAEGLMLEHS